MQNGAAPRQPKICEVCGAEGVKNRYCRSCAVEASRKNMAEIALLSHAKPKSKKTKARISRVLSDHAMANTWWEPSSMPGWLTERSFVEQIQPRLKIKVREIAETMHVSKPYAELVRAGRIPHPRHWQNLSKLVSIEHTVNE